MATPAGRFRPPATGLPSGVTDDAASRCTGEVSQNRPCGTPLRTWFKNVVVTGYQEQRWTRCDNGRPRAPFAGPVQRTVAVGNGAAMEDDADGVRKECHCGPAPAGPRNNQMTVVRNAPSAVLPPRGCPSPAGASHPESPVTSPCLVVTSPPLVKPFGCHRDAPRPPERGQAVASAPTVHARPHRAASTVC